MVQYNPDKSVDAIKLDAAPRGSLVIIDGLLRTTAGRTPPLDTACTQIESALFAGPHCKDGCDHTIDCQQHAAAMLLSDTRNVALGKFSDRSEEHFVPLSSDF